MPEQTEQTEDPQTVSTSNEDESATPAPVKPKTRGAGLAWVFIALGSTLFAISAFWKFGPPSDVMTELTRSGLTLYHVACAGFGALGLGVSMYMSAKKDVRIAKLVEEMEQMEAAAADKHEQHEPREQPERQSEMSVFAERFELVLQNLTTNMTDVREQLEQLSSALSTVEEKVSNSGHSNLSLAASVDAVGVKLEKLQKDVKAPQPKAAAATDDLTPITRMLDSIGRDGHARASRQLEAIEGVLDTMASMEKRMREHIDAVKTSDSSEKVVAQVTGAVTQVTDAVSQLPKQITEPLTAKMGQSMDGVTTKMTQAIDSVMKKMETAFAAQRTELTAMAAESRAAMRTPMPMPMPTPLPSSSSTPAPSTPSTPTAVAPLPSAPEPPESSEFGEGPKETKTVLRAIDKLRSLRGS